MCLLVGVGLLVPRVALVLLWLFTDVLARVFDTFVWPLLGFFVLPTTTLLYAASADLFGGATGPEVVATLLGLAIDLGVIGGGRGIGRRM